MPSRPPEGDLAPADGALPASALDGAAGRPFGVYVHVPFCAVRCGYCDFNTYTAAELGDAPGASQATYPRGAIAELRLARQVLGGVAPEVETVFFGGGTPTLLAPDQLAAMLAAIRDELGLADGAEITTEANPDSVDAAALARLRESGFNRISFGMQSAVPHVLATLDRTHDPERVPQVVQWARRAGFDQVSLDLIYGAPGESLDDWRVSLDQALACDPDHVSAYALIVEDGTPLARRIRRGEMPAPDDDEMADKYALADQVLQAHGLTWYELSNWARDQTARCRHNEIYWRGDNWWGVGPGAHSHVAGVRWWNVRHPRAYAERAAAGVSPAQAREVLDDQTRRVERVLLETRLAEGLPVDVLDSAGRRAAARGAADGRLDPEALPAGRAVLTLRGRLLADAVVRDLLP
ncbi:MAG: radical SAM family heme chaperone HemW [Nocardioidaceae bacterium]